MNLIGGDLSLSLSLFNLKWDAWVMYGMRSCMLLSNFLSLNWNMRENLIWIRFSRPAFESPIFFCLFVLLLARTILIFIWHIRLCSSAKIFMRSRNVFKLAAISPQNLHHSIISSIAVGSSISLYTWATGGRKPIYKATNNQLICKTDFWYLSQGFGFRQLGAIWIG